MSYREDFQRYGSAVDDVVFRRAGRVLLWRTVESESGGNVAMGLGPTPTWRERTITALMAGPDNAEQRTMAGAFAAGEFSVITREKLGPDDELVWNGNVYRIESQPVMSTNTRYYKSIVKRGVNA